MAVADHKLFRIFYKGFYTLLNLALFILLLITPGDTIRQSLNESQIYNVFVIAGTCILTLLLAVLIYFSRIFTNKSILKAIPKTWIPVEQGDVSKKVRKMIVASLNRSAVIAWDSRPRIPQEPPAVVSAIDTRDALAEPANTTVDEAAGRENRDAAESGSNEKTVTIPPAQPVWGVIAHDGWSSPLSPDLPNLQFTTVFLEFANLIEARAVSLAPPDPVQPSLADIRAIELLQRPASMVLRDYIEHLSSIGVIHFSVSTTEFLRQYERARFSGRPISEEGFRELMRLFAELLRSIRSIDEHVIASFDQDQFESDIDDNENSLSTPVTPRSRSLISFHEPSSRSGSEGTIRTARSRRIVTNATNITTTTPSGLGDGFMTVPATPRSKKSAVLSRSSSQNSFAQTRRPYNGNSNSSVASSSSASFRSVSQSSVIRLSQMNDDGELPEVPYTLHVPRSRGTRSST